MTVRRSCAHCHAVNRIDNRPTYCGECGHRADLPMHACDCETCKPVPCATCLRRRTPYDAYRDQMAQCAPRCAACRCRGASQP